VKNYTAHTDNELLLLLTENNEQAFAELYDRYWQKLFAIAYNRIRKTEEAEDIVHDVFASLWTNRDKTEIESPENYLAVATKYLVLTKIKKIQRERSYSNSLYNVPVMDIPVENAVHYKRILEMVRQEVEKLPEKCRLIFRYSRDKGMPVKQIAKELHLSPKTVENQLGKALKHLRLATKNFLHTFFLFIF
jgi:RNA polymerase sigma-70 factor (family 1)